MNNQRINPDKITKPIQLLAAWLIGLILVNASFLTASSQITEPSWVTGALVIATIVNVPIFLISLFLLQTRFRPEMQEDSFYSKYLEQKYNNERDEKRLEKRKEKEEEETDDIVNEIIESTKSQPSEKTKIKAILRRRDKFRLKSKVRDSRSLSELYLHKDKWENLVDKWGKSSDFIRDLEELFFYDLIKGNLDEPLEIELNELGKEIAKELESENDLFNQRKNMYK
ncbi:hypothetical protein [Olleya sp. HaHaR_3_96]|uniref:hypothetical protein n=1 Tax=Olleya sp. HaHaR_3_96 TaxID=2745560 RepID=UPI001C4F791C|nr:hypothetical protein [Olleya sp. HaHaR_3_96]QXP59841.1 hypothetical protein H0I26_18350 [Olleya sp. HaHaR_3_96]